MSKLSKEVLERHLAQANEQVRQLTVEVQALKIAAKLSDSDKVNRELAKQLGFRSDDGLESTGFAAFVAMLDSAVAASPGLSVMLEALRDRMTKWNREDSEHKKEIEMLRDTLKASRGPGVMMVPPMRGPW